MTLYQPANIFYPAVVVEDTDGSRSLVMSPPGPRAYEHRVPYRGRVRPDPIASTLRGIAWTLGVPAALAADVPKGCV